jgi:hypothetical protein
LAVVLLRLFAAGMLVVSPLRVRSQEKIPFRFNQGVARVAGGWILSGTDVLARVDDRLEVVAEQTPAIPSEWAARGYRHVGDVDVVGGVLYAPLEQPDFNVGRQATARYDPTTLRLLDAVELPQHENSFVAVDGSAMVAYSMDHFDGDSLLRYQLPAWTPLPPLRMSTTLRHTQGASVARGAVWISTSDDGNDVYRVDVGSGRVDRVGTLGKAGEGEGIDASALSSRSLHAVRVITGTTDVLFEHLGVPPARQGWSGWVVLGLAVVVFAGIGRWWIRTLRRRRST